ncbi:hypothetical protein [Microbacterium sp. cf332]|uniref:hypothetical protein n=1 Tax=Microbacterium sp. cf332 TaxID=1761804 RepID=UPI000B8779EF|nr:hypothetical protein [Microbacterium sp. cf332]
MSPPTERPPRTRLGAVCLAACVITGVTVAPAAWADTSDAVETIPRSDIATPALPGGDEGDGSGDDEDTPGEEETVPTPEPEESSIPSPGPSGSPSTIPTPPPIPSPEPSEIPSPSVPPIEIPAVPAPPALEVPSVESEVDVRLPTAARLGALLRLGSRDAAAAPTPQPTEEVHVEGGPDVGGSAELNTVVPPQDTTGRTDAVQVGALSDGSGTELVEPVVWGPWAGALGVAAAGVAVFVLRGGRQIGR